MANYPHEYKKVLGYLKKKGVNHIYSVSFGADITTWGYLKYITELPDLSGLTKLKKIVLDGTSIKIDAIDEPYKSMVERYWI